MAGLEVTVALLSGRNYTSTYSPDFSLQQLKEEAETHLEVKIKHLIGGDGEPWSLETRLQDADVVPGTTLSAVVVDQDAEDAEAAARYGIVEAADAGDLAAVRGWLRRDPGAVFHQDDLEDTALHHAAENGWVEMVQLLLAAKAPLEEMNDVGNRPLHDAARRGHVEVVRLLVEAKARINVEGYKLETPLQKAEKAGNDEVVQFLRAASA
eukprot:Skav204079  [mRNA]  locus=scaffold3129:96665:97294:+ [translate_table: standard]